MASRSVAIGLNFCRGAWRSLASPPRRHGANDCRDVFLAAAGQGHKSQDQEDNRNQANAPEVNSNHVPEHRSNQPSCSSMGDLGIYMSACMSAAPSTIVLRAMRVYKAWESTGRSIFAGSCAFPASSHPGVSGVRNRVRISWRFRMSTGSACVPTVIEYGIRVRSTGHTAQATVGRLAPGGHGRCGS